MLRNKLFCFTFLIFLPPLTATSGSWEVIRSSQLSASLERVRFFNENEGFACGSKLLLITRNGGRTWSREEIRGGGMFISPDIGIIFVFDNIIYKTMDGGRSWERHNPNLKVGYHFDAGSTGALYFISSDEGWATATERSFINSIFHTDDGGRTWEKQFDGEIDRDMEFGFWIKDLFFLDSRTGWGAGRLSKSDGWWNVVVGTTDGGKTWFHSVFSDEPGLGEESEIFFTNGLNRILFTNLREGWALGNGVFHTEDGGRSWKRQFDESCCAICFLNEREGWILRSKSLLHTVDGGRTWYQKPFDQPSDSYSKDLWFINGAEGWAVGTWGVMHTRDGGESWERQILVNPDLWSVDFVSPKRGIAVGHEVLTTGDGLNWQKEDWTNDFPNWLSEVDFVDEQTGWVSNGHSLWKTEDHGEIWVKIQDGEPFGKESLCFIDQKRGWMVGWDGGIYRTVDGGRMWDMVSGGLGLEGFTSVNFIDEKNGWATKLSGNVYRTKDGGNKWQIVGHLPEMVTSSSGSICFVNEDMGWIVTMDKIYHTEDGGKTWHLDEHFPNAGIMDICYDGGEHLYAVGSYGIILRYTDPALKGKGYAVESEGKEETLWGKQKLGESKLPDRTAMYQNYPNPFNPMTWIPYQLEKDAEVVISIYSSDGRLVRMLDLGQKSAGFYLSKEEAVSWDGRDSFGAKVAPGIYFYTLRAGDFVRTKKMVVIE